jgi:O-antigen/teichoic acid export membrane protein
VAAALVSGMTLFTPGLHIKKNTTLVAVINILGGIVTIALSYWLILMIGVNGAAMAALLGNVFVFVLFLLFSQRYYPVPYDFKRVSIAVLLCILILMGGSLLKEINLLNISLKVLLLALFAAGTILLKLVEKEKIGMAFDQARSRLLMLQKTWWN